MYLEHVYLIIGVLITAFCLYLAKEDEKGSTCFILYLLGAVLGFGFAGIHAILLAQ